MVRTLKLAIIGYGLASKDVIGPLTKDGKFSVVACADPDPLARQKFVADFGSPTYENAGSLFDAANFDVVYIATPTRLHESLTLMAFDHEVDVLVEKPIAVSLDAGERMVDAANRLGRVLMVNHKRSADRDVLGMWQLTKHGDLGEIRAVNRWHYSDWFYRSRGEDERDPDVGGIVLRQGAHEFDILRMLLPSSPTRVRGWTGDYDASRRGEGAYYAWMEYGNGTVVNSIYNGYDRFRSDEFTLGLIDPEIIGSSRRNLTSLSADAEHMLKRTVGHPRKGVRTGLYGFTLMSCDGADLRSSANGAVLVYDDAGRHEVQATGPTGTEVIVNEFHEAITTGASALHDGTWGLACLELCMGVRESSSTGNVVTLSRQNAVSFEVAQHVIGDRENGRCLETIKTLTAQKNSRGWFEARGRDHVLMEIGRNEIHRTYAIQNEIDRRRKPFDRP